MKAKATITHKPDIYDVISEADDHDGQRVYMEFQAAGMGKFDFDGDMKLRFELTLDDVINMIAMLQKSCAWFHKYMSDEEKKRVSEVIELTNETTVVG